MNKRFVSAAALLLSLLLGSQVWAASTQAQVSDEPDSSDVVVLLDVSQSVLPYFHDITDYVVSSVVKEYMRLGDTFHLLSFGETTQVEISQKISSEADVRSVLARLYLLYPLARNTDLVSAFSNLYQYLSDLPETRSKVVVIITDGIQNPSEKSPAFGLSQDDANAQVELTASKIKRNGWPVYIIKVPFSNDRSAAEAGNTASASAAAGSAAGSGAAAAGNAAASGAAGSSGGGAAQTAGAKTAGGQAAASQPQPVLLDTLSKGLDAHVTEYDPQHKSEIARKSLSLPQVEFPSDLGKKGYTFSFPLRVKNSSDQEVGLELDKVTAEGSNILSKKSFLSLPAGRSGTMNISVALPPAMESGPKHLGLDLYFADGLRVSPSHGTLTFTLAPSPLAQLFRDGSHVLLFIILVAFGLVLILVLINLIRKAPEKAAAPVVSAVRESAKSQTASDSTPIAASAAAVRGGQPAAVQTAARSGTISAAEELAPAASRAPAATASEALPAGRAPLQAETRPAAGSVSRADEASSPLPLKTKQPRRRFGLFGYRKPAAKIPLMGSADASAAKTEETARGTGSGIAPQSRGSVWDSSLPLKQSAAKNRAPATQEQKAAAPRPAEDAAAPAYQDRVLKQGTVQVELRVEGQNSHIGTRNIQTIHAGSARSVGGGRSDFLIFLMPVPRRSAEIHFDGEKCTFVPLKPDLFPELKGQPLEDCVGKDIVMLSRKGFRMTLRFSPYEAPADRINKLLHCIEAPGLQNFNF